MNFIGLLIIIVIMYWVFHRYDKSKRRHGKGRRKRGGNGGTWNHIFNYDPTKAAGPRIPRGMVYLVIFLGCIPLAGYLLTKV